MIQLLLIPMRLGKKEDPFVRFKALWAGVFVEAEEEFSPSDTWIAGHNGSGKDEGSHGPGVGGCLGKRMEATKQEET